MNNDKASAWCKDTALKHIKIAFWLSIISAVFSLIISVDDFLALGRRTTSFIFPYFFNLLTIAISVAQIYIALAMLKLKRFGKIGIFVILVIRLLLGGYDYFELPLTMGLLLYLVWLMSKRRCGGLFLREDPVAN